MGKKRHTMDRMKAWMMEYAYLVTIAAVVAVIAGSAMYTTHLREESTVKTAADAPETRADATETPRPVISPLPTIAPMQVHYTAMRTETVKPVSGAIIRAYDAVDPVLWEALGCVQVHAAIDIAAAAGEEVRCVMDGAVEKTVRDALWGWRVYVRHTDGSEAMYAGLERCSAVEDQVVTRGQTLGTLLESIPCEAELGTHLHMELRQNGIPCDPEAILPL